MFIFDIFKSEARRLRTLSLVMAAGMLALLAGLWFVQIVSGKRMQGRLEVQSFRTPQVPAERGRILDRNGLALVENRPQYNAVLYLEELRSQFTNEYSSHVLKEYLREHPGTGAGRLPSRVTAPLRMEANYRVVSNITYQVGTALEQPVTLDRGRFQHFYTDYTFMPLQILTNLSPRQVAIFSEQLSGRTGLDLERQPVVSYPKKTTAAHLLGYVVRTGADRKYLPPGYKGAAGIEAAFDEELKGRPGTNLVLVNNEGYRQRTDTLAANQAGDDVYLTISLPLQQAVEAALFREGGAGVRGVAVVMDVHTGELLAMASSPTFDPNEFVSGVSPARWQQLNDERLQPQLNRATYDSYPPGSTFKIITTLACLESGVMDVNEPFMVPADPEDPRHGAFMEQGYHIKDTAPPGEYKFESAFYFSSNTYFCHQGMKAGLRKLLEMARRFHLGEKTGFAIAREEVAGNVPPPEQVGRTMPLNSAPYVAIGQEITVTPLQMTVLLAAIANGGTILRPRLVSGARSPETGEMEDLDPAGGPRDQVHIDPRHLQILRNAMLQDTEHYCPSDGYTAFHTSAQVLQDAHFQVAGKTGTAQVNSPGLDYRRVTWFDSYGPFDEPRYAVVVMIVDGGSGGTTCAPVAREIYKAIVAMESKGALRRALTRN
jgi:penicillin-binding protein 2